jgi:hypothetical protein
LKTIKTTILVLLSALTFCALFTSSAYAITGNSKPDSTPYIGVVVAFSDAARQHPIGYSTGFLVSPTVMITAGHSLINAAAVSVCFDSPINYALKDGTIVYYGSQTIYNGVPVTYPGYVPTLKSNQELSTSDIGLITLETPVNSITVFPKLPQAGFADTLSVKTDLNVVGYGVQYQVTPKNNGVINSWAGTLSRNTVQAELLSTHFAGSDKYLRLSANAAQDKGGIAFGDSGGPVIYKANSNSQDMVLAVNAYVNSANCNGVTYHTRIDLPQILSWINGYIA